MNLKQAWERVALAGREIGGGPASVVEYGTEPEKWPGEGEPYFPYKQELEALGVTNRAVALGVVVGLTMAEDQATLDALKKINDDWLNHKLSR